jgi:hypothetical protein
MHINKIKHFDIIKYILILLFCFLMSNFYSLNDGTYVFKISNIKNIFQLSLDIDRDRLNLFVSFTTIVSVFLFLLQWLIVNKREKISYINVLIEELHHNLNIAGQYYYSYDEKETFKSIYNKLKSLNKYSIYPNPTDQNVTGFCFRNLVVKNALTNPPSTIIKLKNKCISSLVTNGSFFSHFSNKRIFINVGHLDYSIDRYNKLVDDYNNNKIKISILQDEYFSWVHYRLLFLLTDIVTDICKNDVIDKKYYDKILKYIKKQ